MNNAEKARFDAKKSNRAFFMRDFGAVLTSN